MLSLTNYREYTGSAIDAIIQDLKMGEKTTSQLMQIRCNGKRLASVSTYVSGARKKLRSQGMTIVCDRIGKVGDCTYSYCIVALKDEFVVLKDCFEIFDWSARKLPIFQKKKGKYVEVHFDEIERFLPVYKNLRQIDSIYYLK
jgi:hypothetical protein